jgi:translation initiation factor IF-2
VQEWVADIAILVVSAEDGVKPQTLEALKCILNEKIPYIVAINKIDKPGANIEVTKQSLAENEVYVEGYGGDIPVVPISALKGDGIPELLDMIMLVSDIADLKANPNVNAEGTIIESYRDNKKGISATLLIKNGTIESGMYVVAEDALSPVRILEDHQGKFYDLLKVYGRGGQTCKKCKKTSVEKIKFAGRGTHYCPRCQK